MIKSRIESIKSITVTDKDGNNLLKCTFYLILVTSDEIFYKSLDISQISTTFLLAIDQVMSI